MNVEALLNDGPYALSRDDKQRMFEDALHDLTRHHYEACSEYRRIVDGLGFNTELRGPASEIPFLPVRLFKMFELRSVETADVIKTMTSSGTTGQGLSKIYLDKVTASLQTKVLSSIVTRVIGPKRLPMLIIDTEKVISDRTMFSARGAAILGFSLFSTSKTFALDDALQLDMKTVQTFLADHAGQDVLVFGFTSVIWEHLCETLEREGKTIDLSRAILIHGGGWKKLSDRNIDTGTFKRTLAKVAGVTKVYNYYGMVEQTGSIFFECEAGNFHCSVFSDIYIRRDDFSSAPFNERGIIESLSLIPWSYPGHALLSEDVGEILGEDDCTCGTLGKYFRVYGRLQKAELRGCSDAV